MRESGQIVPKKHEIAVLREAATAVSEYVIKKADLSTGRRQETPRVSRGRSKDLFHYLSENASLEYVRVSVVRVQISERGSEIRLVEETTGRIGGSIESFSQLLLYIFLSLFPSDVVECQNNV